ncbi:MAG TPA: TlpA disulfide reductase family protein [Gemmatirosa sp.]|nr:TlpA disulfide reductase family protein [Gemmatirosa sp.]
MRRLVVSLALSLLPAAALHAQAAVAVGSRGPSAAVQTLDGRPADLARWVGKQPTLLQFWATWCSSCKALETQLVALNRKYAGRLALVGVAVSVNQSPARVKAFAARHPLPVQLVYDHDGKATDAYDVPATSYVVVLDRTGKVVYTGQGPDQDLDAAVRLALR